jgi:hypothetical protein
VLKPPSPSALRDFRAPGAGNQISAGKNDLCFRFARKKIPVLVDGMDLLLTSACQTKKALCDSPHHGGLTDGNNLH